MNPVRWFRAVMQWYISRSLFLKILIAVPLALVLLAGIYTVMQTVRYHASDLRASAFLPEEADLKLQLPRLEMHLAEWEQSDAWKTFDERILRKGEVREAVNDLLADVGAPTLDELEDQRFHDRLGGWLERERLMRFLGRDVAVAVRAGKGTPDFLLVTKLAWREAVLSPLGWLFSGLAGARKVKLDRGKALEIDLRNRKIWVALRGPLLLVAGSPEILSSALKGSPDNPGDPDGIRVTADLTRAKEWRKALVRLDGGLAGSLLGGLKLGDLRHVMLEGKISGRDLVIRGKVRGWQAESGPIQLTGMMPAETAGMIFSPQGLTGLWTWFQEWIGGSGTSPALASDLAEVVRQVKKTVLETELLPQTREGILLVIGTERYEDGRDYPAVAVVIPVLDGVSAREAADRVLARLISTGVQWQQTTVRGRPLRWLTTPVSLEEEPLVRLTVSDVPEALVLGNNPDLVERILDCWSGAVPGPGQEALPEEGDLFSIRFHPALLRAGLEGMAPILSGKIINNDRSQAALRAEMKKEGLSDREIDRSFNARLEARIASHSEELRRSFDPLRAVELVRIRVSAEGGVNFLVRMR